MISKQHFLTLHFILNGGVITLLQLIIINHRSMSKPNPPKKKVVVTTKQQKSKSSSASSTSKSKAKVKSSSRVKRDSKAQKNSYRSELIISKEQIFWMLGGFALVLLGLILMSGGAMPDPNVWDENIIYSPRRLTLAPILILLGMGVEIYAIFKKKG